MKIEFVKECEESLDFNEEAQAQKVLAFVEQYMESPYEMWVNVTLVDDEAIHQANATFRQVDRETDVLSFPMAEFDQPGDFQDPRFLETANFYPENGELLLGDILLNVKAVKRQAVEYGHSVEREYSFLLVHSMLHLLGFDHMEEEERLVMEEKQRVILDQMGIKRS